MTDWDEMAAAMEAFRKSTDEIKKEVSEQIARDREAGPNYDPLIVAEWMINYITDNASITNMTTAARQQFPNATTYELNQAANYFRDVLKGKLQ